jgi:antitoxin HicB
VLEFRTFLSYVVAMTGNDYPATITPAEEGGFVVSFRDVPEAITQGEDLSDALAEAADCLEEAVAAYLAAGRPLPSASACGADEHPVFLPLQTACKAMLAQALRETGVSKSELARRMGLDVREARRMLDPRHPTKVDRMENALRLLGYRPVLHLTAA